jgi:hypothetical protein
MNNDAESSTIKRPEALKPYLNRLQRAEWAGGLALVLAGVIGNQMTDNAPAKFVTNEVVNVYDRVVNEHLDEGRIGDMLLNNDLSSAPVTPVSGNVVTYNVPAQTQGVAPVSVERIG